MNATMGGDPSSRQVMHIPDIQSCLALMDTYGMWENIRNHSYMVARVATLLHDRLAAASQPGGSGRRQLVIAGGLLHDIAKSKCLAEQCHHAPVGATLCREHGYPEVAEIVANHVILPHLAVDRFVLGEFNAVELVFYADKRVRHDEVVSLDERLAYILGKYAEHERHEELIMKNFEACRLLEHHLFSHIDFSPEALSEALTDRPADLLAALPAAS